MILGGIMEIRAIPRWRDLCYPNQLRQTHQGTGINGAMIATFQSSYIENENANFVLEGRFYKRWIGLAKKTTNFISCSASYK